MNIKCKVLFVSIMSLFSVAAYSAWPLDEDLGTNQERQKYSQSKYKKFLKVSPAAFFVFLLRDYKIDKEYVSAQKQQEYLVPIPSPPEENEQLQEHDNEKTLYGNEPFETGCIYSVDIWSNTNDKIDTLTALQVSSDYLLFDFKHLYIGNSSHVNQNTNSSHVYHNTKSYILTIDKNNKKELQEASGHGGTFYQPTDSFNVDIKLEVKAIHKHCFGR